MAIAIIRNIGGGSGVQPLSEINLLEYQNGEPVTISPRKWYGQQVDSQNCAANINTSRYYFYGEYYSHDDHDTGNSYVGACDFYTPSVDVSRFNSLKLTFTGTHQVSGTYTTDACVLYVALDGVETKYISPATDLVIDISNKSTLNFHIHQENSSYKQWCNENCQITQAFLSTVPKGQA